MRLCWDCWRARANRDAYRQGWEDGLRAGLAAAAPSLLEPGLVRDLIQLAHPDRHPTERFALANRVTAQLTHMLDERRAA
jgi:hypothetical protein